MAAVQLLRITCLMKGNIFVKKLIENITFVMEYLHANIDAYYSFD